MGDYASRGSTVYRDEVVELFLFLSSCRFHFVMLIAVFCGTESTSCNEVLVA